MVQNRSNDYLLNRDFQRNGSFTGIKGIGIQDEAVTESMGPIVDHTVEHLAPSDQMITRTRRRLLMAARALRDKGTLPPGVEDARRLSRRAAATVRPDDGSPRQQVYAGTLADRSIRRRRR
jgi:hypothetical protein